MSKLYLLFVPYDGTIRQIAAFLYNNKHNLLKNGINYQYELSTFWQQYTLEDLISQIRFYTSGRKQKINWSHLSPSSQIITQKLQKLNDCCPHNGDILWLCTLLPPESISMLYAQLVSYPAFRSRSIHPIILTGRQDGWLRTSVFLTWKSYSPQSVLSYRLGECDLGAIYASLTQRAEVEQCTVVTYDTSAVYSLEEPCLKLLSDHFGLRYDLSQDLLYPFPQSAQGLDMAHAIYDFPFTFKGKIQWDRSALYATLCQIEEEEGYIPLTCIPHREASAILKASEAGNAFLAQSLGRESLFSSPHPLDALPDMPDPLPCINTEHCRTFVSALEPEFRQAVLRFFRDLPRPLNNEERILASVVEEYRKKVQASAFAWPRTEPKIAVLTLCHNQESYIRECMESVTMQQCNYDLEHIIVDDASDDNTASIINDYASRHPHVRPIYLEYRSTQGENVQTLFSLCRSTYVALCDGDDYFTDPLKLQKQVDFLENHPRCTLCFHGTLFSSRSCYF